MGLVQLDVCATMLNHVACLLQPVASVTVLADRGFRDRDWAQQWCALGWSYSMGIANNTTVTLPDGRRTRVSMVGVKLAQRRSFPQVCLTSDEDWRGHLAVRGTAVLPLLMVDNSIVTPSRLTPLLIFPILP